MGCCTNQCWSGELVKVSSAAHLFVASVDCVVDDGDVDSLSLENTRNAFWRNDILCVGADLEVKVTIDTRLGGKLVSLLLTVVVIFVIPGNLVTLTCSLMSYLVVIETVP